jgi:two-component system, response regulator PdtaR
VCNAARWKLVSSESQTQCQLTVLIVEDEALVRMALAWILEAEGYAVAEAADSDEALARLHPHGRRLDALITDIEMPGVLDGCDLAWRVHGMFPDAAILVISGRMKPAPSDLPAKARFLEKPVPPENLVKTLGEALAGS